MIIAAMIARLPAHTATSPRNLGVSISVEMFMLHLGPRHRPGNVARMPHPSGRMTARASNAEEIAALLGDLDHDILERIADTGATLEQVAEALSDLEHERTTSERRLPSTTQIAEVRTILKQVFAAVDRGVKVDGTELR